MLSTMLLAWPRQPVTYITAIVLPLILVKKRSEENAIKVRSLSSFEMIFALLTKAIVVFVQVAPVEV